MAFETEMRQPFQAHIYAHIYSPSTNPKPLLYAKINNPSIKQLFVLGVAIIPFYEIIR